MLKLHHNKSLLEAGCDEAGRGCLAGPVFAASVILPPEFKHPLLNDSKQLTEKQRELLRPIIENEAVAWSVAQMDNHKIDEVNILKASIFSMHKAVDSLNVRPEFLLIDGNRFYQYPNIPHECIIRGDGIYMSIAAASVLAKTHRDDYMLKLHANFPMYDWLHNKGYPTKKHREALVAHGACKFHRKSFRLLPSQFSLFAS